MKTIYGRQFLIMVSLILFSFLLLAAPLLP